MLPLRFLVLGAFIDVEPLFVVGVPLSEPAWISACENTSNGELRYRLVDPLLSDGLQEAFQ
jgi:hypothetical protein